MKKMFSIYLELSKPRILFLVVLTTAVGFFLGSQGALTADILFFTLVGTALSCAGSGALNHYLERDADRNMKRTSRRPLPSGLIAPADVLYFGVIFVLLGTTILVVKVNLLSGFLALLTAFLYVLVYTPLKRITWWNTFVGAIPGALPALGGWAAATGNLSLEAWVLFLILFCWQHPHFYAIAWMYKEDYKRGGFKMLPVIEPDGKSTFRQVIIYSLLLVAISLVPSFIGMSGVYYLSGALLMGSAILALGFVSYCSRSVQDARKLLRASILYLPILFLLIVGDANF